MALLGARGAAWLSNLEIGANVVVTVSIWLAARNHPYTWPTGILGCALFCVVFLRNQLYADATLQLFFIATSVLGWWQWLHPALPTTVASPIPTGQRPITRAKPELLVSLVLSGIAVTLAYGWLLHRFTNAFMPYMDAAVLALSVIAQCLQMQRKIETWPFWLAVNTLSIGLYEWRGLKLTAVLYAAYWMNAWYGWWRWRHQSLISPSSRPSQ
jgi:nicotinamide mononucleotide transporter